MKYMKDFTGDGMLGGYYYDYSHVKLKRGILVNMFNKLLTYLEGFGAVFGLIVLLGSVLYIKPILQLLNALIAGLR